MFFLPWSHHKHRSIRNC